MTTTDVTARAELIRDLRAFADLLERRPDMPVHPHSGVRMQYSVLLDDEAARIGEVERIAALLGVDVDLDQRGITAVLDLGRVVYVVHASTDYGHAAYDAERSYRGAVEPDLVGAR